MEKAYLQNKKLLEKKHSNKPLQMGLHRKKLWQLQLQLLMVLQLQENQEDQKRARVGQEILVQEAQRVQVVQEILGQVALKDREVPQEI